MVLYHTGEVEASQNTYTGEEHFRHAKADNLTDRCCQVSQHIFI